MVDSVFPLVEIAPKSNEADNRWPHPQYSLIVNFRFCLQILQVAVNTFDELLPDDSPGLKFEKVRIC